MARIDRFIGPLNRIGGGSIVLAAGEKVMASTRAGTKPMTAEPATAEQVRGFLQEIAPPDRAAALLSGSGGTFTYGSPEGPVTVVISGEGDGLRAQISTDPASAPAAAAGPSAPVPLDLLLRRMVEAKGSDLHISTGNPPLIRKDGDIVPLGEDAALTPDQARDLLLPVMPPRYRDQFDQTRDTDFAHEIAGFARFRCNIFMDRLGMGGVFRVITSKIPTARELGLPDHVLDLCNHSKGLVLVTGPTGSGKSTTLAAMIDHINATRNAHIITIEDPIEFVHPNRKCLVNQREVGNHTQGFKHALRAALREDPDIVLVGEMRDLETVAIAIETAETGHLVFGTLHTSTAASTVDRIIDQFPSDRQSQIRVMLSESLKGVISQALCKKPGGGRVAAWEILLVNGAVSNLIRESKTFQIPSIMQAGKGVGMVCLNDSLLDLVRRKLVSPEEALHKAIAKNELSAALARAGLAALAGSAG